MTQRVPKLAMVELESPVCLPNLHVAGIRGGPAELTAPLLVLLPDVEYELSGGRVSGLGVE